MRAWISGAIVGGACLLPALGAAQSPAPKTVYVSSQRLFAAAPGWDQAESQFTHIVDSVHTEEKRLDDSMATLLTAYGRDEATMGADARVARRKDIERQHTAFNQRRDEMEGAVAEKRAALLDPISEHVRAMLARVRKMKGYAMILDMDAGSILAADSTLDITDQVVAELKTIARR
jgi:Skp family chaperone for outer membrane proteins